MARRRCLPYVPAREENSGDVKKSAEAVHGLLVIDTLSCQAERSSD